MTDEALIRKYDELKKEYLQLEYAYQSAIGAIREYKEKYEEVKLHYEQLKKIVEATVVTF